MGPVGADAAAYAERDPGYSPDAIRDAAVKLLGNEVRGRILDAGSGSGSWLRLLLKSFPNITHATSVDIFDAGASKVEGVEFFLGDVCRDPLPIADASLDWVFAIEVVEHLANPRAFLKEAARCLRPGASLFLSTPNNDALTSRLSLLFRGYFPAFSDENYRASGHITPVLAVDLRRMANELGFSKITFAFPLGGRIPKMAMEWQRVLPGLRGSLWSDVLFCRIVR
ncbi:MAG: class I SAM-dependent methyltransferase [Polyangiaceae bacterium]